MLKKLFSFTVATGLIFGLFSSSPSIASAGEKKGTGKCSITITTDNTYDNKAQATGLCKGYIYGYYVSGQFVVDGAYTGEVVNGQKITFFLPPDVSDYYNYELTVKTVAKKNPVEPAPKPAQPKPEPKPEVEKPSKPSQTPKPANPKPAQNPKPTQKPNQATSQNQTQKSNQTTKQNQTQKSNQTTKQNQTQKPNRATNQNQATSQSQAPRQNQASPAPKNDSHESKTSSNVAMNKVEGDKKIPDEKEVTSWTTEDLKAKGAKVVEKDGKLFAFVDGVYVEITEDQAKELGYKKENETQKAENDEEENVVEDKKDDEKQNSEKKEKKNNAGKVLPIVAGATTIAGATIAGLYYFHPSTKEIINKIIQYILNLFKK